MVLRCLTGVFFILFRLFGKLRGDKKKVNIWDVLLSKVIFGGIHFETLCAEVDRHRTVHFIRCVGYFIQRTASVFMKGKNILFKVIRASVACFLDINQNQKGNRQNTI